MRDQEQQHGRESEGIRGAKAEGSKEEEEEVKKLARRVLNIFYDDEGDRNREVVGGRRTRRCRG